MSAPGTVAEASGGVLEDEEQDPRLAWPLAPDLAYLNHGAFGVTPSSVLARRSEMLKAIETNPLDFFVYRVSPLLDEARRRVASFLGSPQDHLVFVDNASTGLNVALNAVCLQPGDEVLITDHAYPAARLAAERRCQKTGARVVTARLGLPADDDVKAWHEDLLSRIQQKLSSRTRLLIVDHVASPTAAVFPVRRITDLCRRNGVPVCVDGAHAPGMLEAPCADAGAQFWVGNLHKWAFAAKTAAVLVVEAAWQDRTLPLVTANRAGTGYLSEFAYQGTQDLTAYLTSPHGLDFPPNELGLSWSQLRAQNSAQAEAGARLIAEATNGAAMVATHPQVSMRVVRLPDSSGVNPATVALLSQSLRNDYKVEVPVTWWNEAAYIRISAQVYNHERDYRRLAEGLVACLRKF